MNDEPTADELVMPFVVCASAGGPYDDRAFVAGFIAGNLERSMAISALTGVTEIIITAYTELSQQLDLIAMNHGFTTVEQESSGETSEWTTYTFRRKP